MRTRGIEHVALTVPDIEQATAFLQKAFGAKVMYDGHRPSDPPVRGELAEAVFGMPRGGMWRQRRLLELGGEAKLELFHYVVPEQRHAARTYDIGLQHVAIYVDDLAEAARRFVEAGGELYPMYDPIMGLTREVKVQGGWVYGIAPWGTIFELVTFPS